MRLPSSHEARPTGRWGSTWIDVDEETAHEFGRA